MTKKEILKDANQNSTGERIPFSPQGFSREKLTAC